MPFRTAYQVNDSVLLTKGYLDGVIPSGDCIAGNYTILPVGNSAANLTTNMYYLIIASYATTNQSCVKASIPAAVQV